ncbi:MAG: methyltransferase domain-containing protein [Bacteroidales bacterium]|nr:methyltransferase domain-containing protein [Bacteroidales bacterium]
MKFISKAWKYLISFFIEQIIEKTNSEINPVIEVNFVNGRYVLNSKIANYSYGGLHKAFQKAFQKINIKNKKFNNVLILGFGAGSVASILQNEYKINCKIVGIEKDSKIIEIANKYFIDDTFRELTLHCIDAYDFIMNSNESYDLIIMDVYIDNNVPEKFEKEQFLKNLKNALNKNGMILFNKLVYDKSSENSAIELLKHFNTIFGKTELYKIKGGWINWMLFY